MYIKITLICWLLAGWVVAQPGIAFHTDASWEVLLRQAKTEQKLVFVDAYTTWCGPCKTMDQQVFSQAAVGDFYNQHFISAKFDMEQGEGAQIAKMYTIRAYPTFLFVDSDGKVVHRLVGLRPVEELLDAGRTALHPEKNLAALAERFATGDRNPLFINTFINALQEAQDPRLGDVLEGCLQPENPDWQQPAMLRLLVETTKQTHSKKFKYLLERRALFEQEIGQRAYLNKVQNIVLREGFLHSRQGTPPALDSAKALLEARLPADLAAQLFLNMQMNHFLIKKEIENYSKTAMAYYQQYPCRELQELNAVAWTFYEQVNDPAQLREAVKWAQQSVALNSYSFNNETLAALYYKLGEQENARTTAEKALALARANKESDVSILELLAKINKM